MADREYIVRTLKGLMGDPKAAANRLLGRWDQWQDRQTWRKLGVAPRDRYGAHPDADRRFHELIGAPWPCPLHEEFEALLRDVEQRFDDQVARQPSPEFAAQSDVLRRNFDADLTVTRAAFCAIRHLNLSSAAETGVARGVTSRFVLDALARNAAGHLWSVDLPHPHTTRFNQIGSAVPDDARGRWTLVLGPSTLRLPAVLRDAGTIDIFVQDSLHTKRNVYFELDLAWKHLRPGGVILVDDVHRNLGFEAFVNSVGVNSWVVGLHTDAYGLWGAIVKPDPQLADGSEQTAIAASSGVGASPGATSADQLN